MLPAFLPSIALHPPNPHQSLRHFSSSTSHRTRLPLHFPITLIPPTACTPPPPDSDEKVPYKLMPGEIGVRFVNTPSGDEVVAAARPGDLLLKVGDSVGVHIPRGCLSGLCGTCTCDIVDASSESGRQTVRACQTTVVLPDDGVELVVDVERMKSVRKRKEPNPMARFDNLDTEYVAGAAPRKKGKFMQAAPCKICRNTGDVECYSCDGEGEEDGLHCLLCSGSGTLRCAECQGTGIMQISR